MTPLELLAPARTADIGIAAIRCGADAVYIGGPAFGARAAAGNSIDEIRRLCGFASRYGAGVFVTVNTLFDEEEKRDVVEMMMQLKDIGISAFILQDCTILPLLWRQGPWKEEFHASTQCAIRTPERAVELAGMGFSRLVLERELSLEQIRAIRAATADSVELECFVHGALCVCYSGDCYLSEYLTGRSANRGECAQPCRSLYDLVDDAGKTLVCGKPLLSLKDFCLINRLEDLAEAGVISFKIEGRLKNESYVKNVVKAYDNALNELVDTYPERYCRSSAGRCAGGFSPRLEKTFNRDFTSLFLDGKRGDWHTVNAAKAIGEPIGQIIGTAPDKAGAAKGMRITLLSREECHNGDGFCTIASGNEVKGFRADVAEAVAPQKGPDHTYILHCKGVEGLHKGDKVWRNFDISFEKALEHDMPQRMIDVDLYLQFLENGVRVTAESLFRGKSRVTVVDVPYECTLPADNQDRMEEVIVSQLNKSSGIFRFHLKELSHRTPLPIMKASWLNGIRRSVAERLDGGFACTDDRPEAHAVQQDIAQEKLVHTIRPRELMRTRYCIKHRLGLCGKDIGLSLRNNGRVIPLEFDCAHCEMVLVKPEKAGAPM